MLNQKVQNRDDRAYPALNQKAEIKMMKVILYRIEKEEGKLKPDNIEVQKIKRQKNNGGKQTETNQRGGKDTNETTADKRR